MTNIVLIYDRVGEAGRAEERRLLVGADLVHLPVARAQHGRAEQHAPVATEQCQATLTAHEPHITRTKYLAALRPKLFNKIQEKRYCLWSNL